MRHKAHFFSEDDGSRQQATSGWGNTWISARIILRTSQPFSCWVIVRVSNVAGQAAQTTPARFHMPPRSQLYGQASEEKAVPGQSQPRTSTCVKLEDLPPLSANVLKGPASTPAR